MKKRSFFLCLFIIVLAIGVSVGVIAWYFGEMEKSKEKTVQLAQEEPKETTIKIYFGNKDMNPDVRDCRKVFPVERMIPNDLIIRRRAIEEILAGPTAAEKELGYYSNIPDKEEIINYREKIKQETGEMPYNGDEIKIRSVKILSGSAYLDFSEEMISYGGEKCRADAIKAQFNETVKQFPKIGAATLSIEGGTNAF